MVALITFRVAARKQPLTHKFLIRCLAVNLWYNNCAAIECGQIKRSNSSEGRNSIILKLPETYIEKMKTLLGNDLDAYLASFDEDRAFGVRVNTLKCDTETFERLAEGFLSLDGHVPWCKEGYYYKDSQPGRHPYYHAGLYYIQEPSAMFPAAAASCRPGERVLDLCAAPGGKSTQAACALKGAGLLVSNDISEERTKALVKNIEMAGIRNALITNESPAALAKKFPCFFDRILVDAPCSGEGMFRKDEEAVSSWESFKSERCREMQDEILEEADKMLKYGGTLVYSTCTFSPLENEQTLEAFLHRHPDYFIKEVSKPGGIGDGLPQFCTDPEGETAKTLVKAARLWPQRLRGEGHFTALLQKGEAMPENTADAQGAWNDEVISPRRKKKRGGREEKGAASFHRFAEIPESVRAFFRKNMMCEPWSGVYFSMGNFLYYLPEDPPDVDGIKIARAGVLLGSIQYEDFKPAHPFAVASRAEDFRIRIELAPDSDDMSRYLKGETLTVSEEWRVFAEGMQVPASAVMGKGGLCAVCAGPFIVGMGRLENGMVKNLYPKGWRRMR